MPLYTYICKKCSEQSSKFRPASRRLDPVPCECGGEAVFILPSTTASEVLESADSYRGKQIRKGVDRQLKKRMNEHHDRYEVAEKVDKHGLDAAERHGWDKKLKR